MVNICHRSVTRGSILSLLSGGARTRACAPFQQLAAVFSQRFAIAQHGDINDSLDCCGWPGMV